LKHTSNFPFLNLWISVLLWGSCFKTFSTKYVFIFSSYKTNFCGQSVPCGQRDRSIWPYSLFSIPELLLFHPNSASIVITKLGGPCSRPTTSYKIWQSQESNLDFTNFANKQQSLSRYSSLSDSGHGVSYKAICINTSMWSDKYTYSWSSQMLWENDNSHSSQVVSIHPNFSMTFKNSSLCLICFERGLNS
jgi:hypothetical protein